MTLQKRKTYKTKTALVRDLRKTAKAGGSLSFRIKSKTNLHLYKFLTKDAGTGWQGDYFRNNLDGLIYTDGLGDECVKHGYYYGELIRDPSKESSVILAKTKNAEGIIRKAEDEIIRNVGEKTDYAIVRAVHDYICRTYRYDQKQETDSQYIYAVHSGLIICEGYAALFYKMVRDLGIGCRMIESETGEDYECHAFNIVRVGGLWYYIDACWDDTDFDENPVNYSYFLKTAKSFQDNFYHVPDKRGRAIVSKLKFADADYEMEGAK